MEKDKDKKLSIQFGTGKQYYQVRPAQEKAPLNLVEGDLLRVVKVSKSC
jgi:hypothetical protein